MNITSNFNYSQYNFSFGNKTKENNEQIPFKGKNDVTLSDSMVLNNNNYNSLFSGLKNLMKSKANTISFGSQLTQAERTAHQIAEVLYSYRKPDGITTCTGNPCIHCVDAIANKVKPFVERCNPIQMLIICFPFKSPSKLKVLSEHADMAEVLSLKHLRRMISHIEEVYRPKDKPGAQINIYSDSLVFSASPVLRPDNEARQYGTELKDMIGRMELGNHITYKTMEDVNFLDRPDIPKDIEGRRQWMRDHYGCEYTEQKIKEKMAASVHYRNFVGSIQKFYEETMKGYFASAGEEALQKKHGGKLTMLVDDRDYVSFVDTVTGKTLDKGDPRLAEAVNVVNVTGRTALGIKFNDLLQDFVRLNSSISDDRLRLRATSAGGKKISQLTYKILHLDQSWVSLVNEQTANDVRFSMHPQPCGSFKTGIELVPGSGWIGPWQSTAVDLRGQGQDTDFVLTKNVTAKKHGCQVVNDPHTGFPSHYVLPQDQPNREAAIAELCTKK